MALTYTLGGEGVPRKKKVKKAQQPTPSESGRASRLARAKKFTPSQNKEVADTVQRNVDTDTAVKQGKGKIGTTGDDHGQLIVGEKTRKSKKSLFPKFRK